MKLLLPLIFSFCNLAADELQLLSPEDVSISTSKNVYINERVNFPLTQHLPITPKVNVANGEYLEDAVDMIPPGAYISPETCGKIIHLVSTRDFVPWFDFIGRWKCRDTIEFLTPHKDAGLFDHTIISPTFKRPIKENIYNFLN